jgi:hypothetical protein
MSTKDLMLATICAAVFACHAQVSPSRVASAAASSTNRTLHPWQAALPGLTPEAYFSNLQDNARIETPFRVTFGLSGGWGLAPISKPVGGKSGHHHLLVNKELPLDFKKPLPFDDQYIHFGKGQMQTVLMLEPGVYNLRLLLANDKHLPHFVYSKPMKVTVTRKNADVDPKSLAGKGIAFLNLLADQKVKSPFRLQFHASQFNIAHAEQNENETGHFRLTLTPANGGKPAEMDFTNGQTEVWLAPPAGSYNARLDLIANAELAGPMTESVVVPLQVQ